MKYICELCGYEYDPAAGDPENGVAEKTEFEDIPANWVCPLCGASKQDFEAPQIGQVQSLLRFSNFTLSFESS